MPRAFPGTNVPPCAPAAAAINLLSGAFRCNSSAKFLRNTTWFCACGVPRIRDSVHASGPESQTGCKAFSSSVVRPRHGESQRFFTDSTVVTQTAYTCRCMLVTEALQRHVRRLHRQISHSREPDHALWEGFPQPGGTKPKNRAQPSGYRSQPKQNKTPRRCGFLRANDLFLPGKTIENHWM